MQRNQTKRVISSLIAAWIAAQGTGTTAPDEAPQEMRDIPSREQLEEVLRGTQDSDPMAALAPVAKRESEAAATNPAPADFVASSLVLCNLGIATLIPNHAVLHVPKRFESRLKMQPNARIRTFPEFVRTNQTWVRTFEVTQAQAEGSEAIDPEAFENEKRLGRVIVATFHGGPISVLPAKEPGEESPRS